MMVNSLVSNLQAPTPWTLTVSGERRSNPVPLLVCSRPHLVLAAPLTNFHACLSLARSLSVSVSVSVPPRQPARLLSLPSTLALSSSSLSRWFCRKQLCSRSSRYFPRIPQHWSPHSPTRPPQSGSSTSTAPGASPPPPLSAARAGTARSCAIATRWVAAVSLPPSDYYPDQLLPCPCLINIETL